MTTSSQTSSSQSTGQMTWRGAREIVNMRKALTWGAWYVAEYRLRNMSKWLGAIIAFGLGNPILLLLSVGIGIGSLVDNGSGGNPIDGVGYLVFLAPALLASASIQSAMDETTFPTMQGFVWDKSFFSMNSTQLRGRSIVSGIMISSAIRCVLTVFMFEAILMAFGAVSWESIPALTWTSIIAGISFASVMLAATSFVKQDDGFFAIVGRFIIAPMFMFSGTYYPLNILPEPLQVVGWISPLWHATDLGRHLSYGLPVEGWVVGVHYAYLIVLYFIGHYIASRQFEKRLGA
jgi:lipooligosaccharide transport system permease protein